MPGKFLRKRAPRRRVYRKRAIPIKLYAKRQRAARMGGFTIVRKLPIISFSSSAAGVGTYTLNDPTGTCVSLGAPSLSPGTTNQYDIPFSMKFALNQLQAFTDITQISDSYRINSVLVKLTSGFQVATGIGAAVPFIEYVQDHDDATLPSATLMRQKMGAKTKYFGPTKTMVKMGVRPKTADEIYNNGITTAYGVNRAQWINCDYPAAEHYALKGIIHNAVLNGTANTGLFTFDVSVSVSARDLQ